MPLSAFNKPGRNEAAAEYQNKLEVGKEILFQDDKEKQELREQEKLPNIPCIVETPAMTTEEIKVITNERCYHTYISQCEFADRKKTLENIIKLEKSGHLPVSLIPQYSANVMKHNAEKLKLVLVNKIDSMMHAELDYAGSGQILDVYKGTWKSMTIPKKEIIKGLEVYIWYQGLSGLIGPIRKHKLLDLCKPEDIGDNVEVTLDDDKETERRTNRVTGQITTTTVLRPRVTAP